MDSNSNNLDQPVSEDYETIPSKNFQQISSRMYHSLNNYMKYSVTRLDGRYSYRQNFEFYLGFASTMARQQGPVAFNDAMTWLTERYGWSAEIKQWHNIDRWTSTSKLGVPIAAGILAEPSAHCNPHWSWSNLHTDLRIYLASEQELAFFQLAHPVDQKRQ